ncbi:response regulator [Sphingomonas sp. 1P06PA]|uniref:response regulator n=1 Tax=Sphingomonas sp. 1P06PA TaxID=554121 RepID=UPI0039A5E73E
MSVQRNEAMPGSILIIEDDRALRDELVELAGALGAAVIGVANGDDARRACEQMPFSLILCDYKLQAETGLEVLKTLRLRHQSAPPPIIYLMTGHLDLTTAARQQIDDATDGLLMKPVRSSELRNLILSSGSPASC